MRRAGKGEGEEDPRADIPPQRKELLVNWLTNKNMVSPENVHVSLFEGSCFELSGREGRTRALRLVEELAGIIVAI